MSDDKPTIIVTESAARAFRGALESEGEDAGNVVRLTIDAHFQNDLYIGAAEPGDLLVTASGITVAMDGRTARRAGGLTIDYVEGPTGAGFKLTNPNESPPVKGIRPADVVRQLEGGERFELVDARGDDERAKATVAAARPLDARYEEELSALSKKSKLVFMAHHSRGGQSAATRFFERGFSNVWYVVGGIDAWSTMDPSVPRY